MLLKKFSIFKIRGIQMRRNFYSYPLELLAFRTRYDFFRIRFLSYVILLSK